MSLSEYPVSQTASTIKLYQNNANEIETLFANYKHVPVGCILFSKFQGIKELN